MAATAVGRRKLLTVGAATAAALSVPAALRTQSQGKVRLAYLQLGINKEYGFLKSDIWDNPDRIRREFFHRS